MDIKALDGISRVQSRIQQIEEKITGFSEVFQAELQNISPTNAATDVENISEVTKPETIDYSTLMDQMNSHTNINGLSVDGGNTIDTSLSAFQQMFGRSPNINSALAAYAQNSNFANLLGSSQTDGLDFSNILNGQTDTVNLSSVLKNLAEQISEQNKDEQNNPAN